MIRANVLPNLVIQNATASTVQEKSFASLIQDRQDIIRMTKGYDEAEKFLDTLDLAAIKEAQYYPTPLKSPEEVQAFLSKTKIHRRYQHHPWQRRKMRFLVDSGCSDTLVGAGVEIENENPSNVVINTANGITRAASAGDKPKITSRRIRSSNATSVGEYLRCPPTVRSLGVIP
jgi:hypothetical protein